MAIRNIPNVLLGGQSRPYGGVIYGLNMSIGYSSEPSKLIIDIVNENGVYSTPTLNSNISVSFGDFNFNGIVWSYNIKESADEKTLQVTAIDNSIILDRYYVLLWKRGLLGEKGSPITKRKTFDFSSERILVPVQVGSQFPVTKFEERSLGSISLNSESYSLGGKIIGNVILLGTEKFSNSVCDIPDTYYLFDDLKSQMNRISIKMENAPNNKEWKATHEGTLREVLSSWCSDLGFDYYWNFSSNSLVFYNVSKDIATIRDVEAPNITSKEKSVSLEGTFKHYGIGYTAIPKSPVKSLTASRSVAITYNVNPYPISYFINKIGIAQNINSIGNGKWGGSRTSRDFTHAGLLGFVCRSLRDLFCFQNKHWSALGYVVDSGVLVNKKQIINLLKNKLGYDLISDLESFDAKDLPNYEFAFISRDQTLADAWYEKEQELLQYLGRYYRSSDSSGSFFYCNKDYTVEIEISVDPEGQSMEEDNIDFAGRKVINRGGSMSHDASQVKEEIQYEKLINEIQNCSPIHIDLKESGIFETLVSAKILKNESKVNTLVIYPKSEEFVKTKLGFTSSVARKGHPLEKTWMDIRDANISSGRKNCPDYEKNLEKNSCKSKEETARDEAMKKAGGTQKEGEDDLVSGLINKLAESCTLKLKTGSSTFFAPSDAPMRVVCRYNININKISTYETEEFLWSSGLPGKADHVAEIRISNENISDPDEDSYQSQRPGVLIRPADSSCEKPQEQIKYTFAGEPQGIRLTPENGLSNLDISLSSDGFTTTATFSTKPAKISKANNVVRYVQSQFNRASYNAS